MNAIEGMVEEIIFRNETTGYVVCNIRHNDNIITLVGYIPYINEGETLRVTGKWTTHHEYGEQLKVEYFEKIQPTTTEAIEKYLASGIVKGIGPATAKRIVERFGEQAIFVIENDPHQLSLIKGISSEKALAISNAFIEQRELKQVVMFFQEYNISTTYAIKIYKAFGNRTVDVIKENPYKLVDEIIGIGFKIADKIAKSMGIDNNSEYRLCSGIKYVLSQFSNIGHTFVPKEELINVSTRLLESRPEIIENALIRLTIDKQVYLEEMENFTAIYLAPFYFAELGVVRKLIELSTVNNIRNIKDIEKKISEVEKESKIILEEMQKHAIKEALENGTIVITGGPGTGKTTIINSMLKLFDQLKYKTALTAPTGRAAKRMSEACGREAKTIHRLLEIGYIDNQETQIFNRNETNPLDYDVIIVDEVSMVDILLMNHLLKAILPSTRLILVGDTDQLPSVGPGRVLKDIIDSGTLKVVRLTEIFRQAQESTIIVNAHKINKGESPYINTENNDFFFIKRNVEQNILREILGLVKERLPAYSNLEYSSIQVLTPMRKGTLGILNLNNELQAILNPPLKEKSEKQFRGIVFREGDKVMQIKNNYNIMWQRFSTKEEGMGIFNGDIGFIQEIDNENQILTVIFDDDKIIYYDFNQLDELELAYAVTVHKSQGCEFPVIVMPISSGPPVLLTRNLIYTAVTRAKDMVVLVGREEYLQQMIDNNNESKRYSGLSERLKTAVKLLNTM